MPELTPDPVFDTLARFTPDDSALDPAAILFRAGKASARTPLAWKLATAGLLLTTLTAVGFIAVGRREAPRPAAPPAPEQVVVPVVVPVLVEVPPPTVSPEPAREPSRWSLGALIGTTDADQLPKPDRNAESVPASTPLTPLAARRVNLD